MCRTLRGRVEFGHRSCHMHRAGRRWNVQIAGGESKVEWKATVGPLSDRSIVFRLIALREVVEGLIENSLDFSHLLCLSAYPRSISERQDSYSHQADAD